MKKSKYFFAVCLTGLFCVSDAFSEEIKPSVKLIRVRPQIAYEISKPETNCKSKVLNDPSLRNHQDGGCTVPQDWVGKVSVNCEDKQITLSFGYQKYVVQIANQYQKGTAMFDHILKHESTHVSLYKKTTEKFYQPVSQALLMQYERSEQNGKSCQDIATDVGKMFNNYMKLFQKECKRQNDLIDGAENHEYQDAQVYMMLPPKITCVFGKTGGAFSLEGKTDAAEGRIAVKIIFPEKAYSEEGRKILINSCKEIEAQAAKVFKIRRQENKKPKEFLEEIMNLAEKMTNEKIKESSQNKMSVSNKKNKKAKERQ